MTVQGLSFRGKVLFSGRPGPPGSVSFKVQSGKARPADFFLNPFRAGAILLQFIESKRI